MNKPIYLQRVMLFLLLLTGQQISAQSSTSWLGTYSTAWNLTSNWTNGIPDSTKDVYIGDSFYSGPFEPNITVTGSCKSITIGGDNAVTFTMTRSLRAIGNVNILSNGTLSVGGAVLSLKGNWNNNGTFTTTASSARVSLIGSSLQTIGGTAVTNFRVLYVSPGSSMTLGNNITLSGAGSVFMVYGEVNPGSTAYTISSSVATKVYNGGVLKVYQPTFAGNYVLSGLSAFYDGSVVDYAADINQTVSGAYSYSTLKISGNAIKSLNSNLPGLNSRSSSAGKIIVQSGTFDMKFYSANRGTTVAGGEFSVADGATLKISGESNFPRNFNRVSFETNSTTQYYGNYQNIAEATYGNLTISGNADKMINRDIAVQGDLTVLQGNLNADLNAVTVSVAGNFVMTGGTLVGANATYEMMGSGDQIVNILGNVDNFKVNKTGGSVVLGADINIPGTLTFDAGLIRTYDNYVVMGAIASVIGGSQNRGWVNGNLKKMITAGSSLSVRYEVGTADDYTPATVNFNSVTVAGFINAKATINDHPEINYSGINPSRSVNRYWDFTNEGVAFDRSDVTFNWNGSNYDGGASTSSFIAAQFNGTAWSLLTTTARLSQSLVARNISDLSQFALGEKIDIYTWTGDALTADWFTPKNWLGGVPDLDATVLITNDPLPRRYYPVVSGAAHAQVKDMTIQGDASLTLDDATIEIAGNASSEGVFDATNGTVEFNGSTAQTINSGLFYGNKVKNLVISNDVTLADTDTLTGVLTVANEKTFSTNDNLTLKSDANGTARIAPLPVNGAGVATATILGAVSIERFIPARKAWRLLSAPVLSSSSPTIVGSWQEGAYGSSLAPNPNPHYGVHITGGTVSNGFDQSLTNFPSVKVYDNTLNSFVGLPAAPGTIRPITDYNGYMVYIRGDRSIDLMQGVNAAITSTTLRVRGEVITGKQSKTVNAHNFTVLGNPFASPINFGTLTRSNVKNSFYIWDPKLGGSNGLGAYVVVSYNSGTGSYDVTANASGISQYIPSGEAILIESEDGATAGTIQIQESDKTSLGSDALFGRTSTTAAMRANLMTANNTEEYALIDGAMTAFHMSASNEVNRDDISKMNGSAENISFNRAGKKMAIERRKSIEAGDTSFLHLTQLKMQPYRLAIAFENINANGLVAYVKDNFTGNTTTAELKGSTYVDFQVTADPLSYAADRFYVVFATASQKSETVPVAQEKTIIGNQETAPTAVVYPNPVVTDNISYQLKGMEAGRYAVKLYNISGQLIHTTSLQYSGNGEVLTLKVNSGFTPGKYELRIDGMGKTANTSVLKQ